MRLPDLFRTSIFRLTAFFTLGSAATSLVLFAFIYWQTAVYERERTSELLVEEITAVAGEQEADLHRAVATRLESDIHRVAYAALFNADGRAIVGNLAFLPLNLVLDGAVHSVEVDRDYGGWLRGTTRQRILAVGLRLPGGDILVIGRNIDELRNMRTVVKRSLVLGVVPALMLALLAGAFLSRRFHLKIVAANQTVRRVMRGDLHERLPVTGGSDDFDQLADAVNQMLDEIERMVGQIRGAADSIAHDVRVPLIQMHARLERTRTRDHKPADINAVVDRALTDLNIALDMIAALTRISEIHDDRRRAAFAIVDMATVMQSVFDLYEPVAEEKKLRFTIAAADALPVHGDPDLLRDLLANLVDNAIKFSPAEGAVSLSVSPHGSGHIMARVTDTGPGVPEQERGAIFTRFYRAHQTQHLPGHGLGLSLVRAVADLHGFEIRISDGKPGAIFEMICPVTHPGEIGSTGNVK